MWLAEAIFNISMWFGRVESPANAAELPARDEIIPFSVDTSHSFDILDEWLGRPGDFIAENRAFHPMR